MLKSNNIGLMDRDKLLEIFDYLNQRFTENQLQLEITIYGGSIKVYSNLKILKPKAEQLLAMKVLAARAEPAKDFMDANILCKSLNITTKTELLDIISGYIPLTLLGERQVKFIKYLGEDLGYDWE